MNPLMGLPLPTHQQHITLSLGEGDTQNLVQGPRYFHAEHFRLKSYFVILLLHSYHCSYLCRGRPCLVRNNFAKKSSLVQNIFFLNLDLNHLEQMKKDRSSNEYGHVDNYDFQIKISR